MRANPVVSRAGPAPHSWRCGRGIAPVSFLIAVLGIAYLPANAWAGPAPTADMVSDEPLIVPVITHHHISVNSSTIEYSATLAETPLNDAQGREQATISATMYLREGVGNVAERPVVFLFNGGPGASSSPLHFGAFGPKRFSRDASGERVLVDNSFSLIDAADLVFIDPVGTGFSRERPGSTSGSYWTPQTDAQAVLTLIRQWLEEHHRQQSPLFIAGESYGGFRLAMMMHDATDLPIAGLILISPMLDASGSSAAVGNDQPFIFDLPTLAVAAWEHRKVERGTATLEQVYERARQFAQSDYALALQKGSTLSPAERDRLARRLARLIGLATATVAQANLRIDSQVFLETLLADQGLLVGRLDTRVTAKKPEKPINPDRPPAANDPALGLGPSNVIKSDAIKSYMEHELGVNTKRDYLSLTLDVNFRWDWRQEAVGPDGKGPIFYINATPNIAAIMKKQPKLRLLLVGGYYDLAVPLLAPRYALEHAGVPLERVEMEGFRAGHSPFDGDQNLKQGSEIVRKFVREHP
jgi:carboxypeptidase C (cathepsin A)